MQHSWPKRASSLAKCVACLLVCWVGSRGLRSTLALTLEWMTSLASRALVGVESDMCHQNKPPSLGCPQCCPLDPPSALPWLCDPARGQLQSLEGAVRALVTRLCSVSCCAVSRSATSLPFWNLCPWSANSAQEEHNHHQNLARGLPE